MYKKYKRKKYKNYIEDNFDLEQYKYVSENKTYVKAVTKNKKVINIITILIVAFSILLAILVYKLANYYINLSKNEKINEEAKKFVQVDFSNELPLFSTTREDVKIITDKKELPTTKTKTMSKTFVDLREKYKNNDIVAYLNIYGTKIDNVVAKSDDNDFYLNHNLYKEENLAGSVFMDFENDVKDLSRHIVLYGHNMRNGTMFHNVRFYSDESYLKDHKIINLKTLYDDTKWEVFAFYSTNVEFDYIKTNFNSDQQFQAFLDDIQSKSFYTVDKNLTVKDKILTLSTCTNVDEDTRFVVHAKLIEKTACKDPVD